MNKLHTFTFYALITPAMTLGAGSVLAEKSADQDMDSEQWSTIGAPSTIDRKQQSLQYDQDMDNEQWSTIEAPSTMDRKQQSLQYDQNMDSEQWSTIESKVGRSAI